jgi:hypothetical protein
MTYLKEKIDQAIDIFLRILFWGIVLCFPVQAQYQIIDNVLYLAIPKEGISNDVKLERIGPISDSEMKSLISKAIKNHFKVVSEKLQDIKGMIARSDSLYIITDNFEIGFQIKTQEEKKSVTEAVTTLYKGSYSKIREVRGVR